MSLVFGQKPFAVLVTSIFLALGTAQASSIVCETYFEGSGSQSYEVESTLSLALSYSKPVVIGGYLKKKIQKSLDLVRSVVSTKKVPRFENLMDLVLDEPEGFSPAIMAKVIEEYRITGEDYIKFNLKRFGFQVSDADLLSFLNTYIRIINISDHALGSFIPLLLNLTEKSDQAELAANIIQTKIDRGEKLDELLEQIIDLPTTRLGLYFSQALFTNLFNKFSFFAVDQNLDEVLQLNSRYPNVFTQVPLLRRYTSEFQAMDHQQILDVIKTFDIYGFPNYEVLKVGFYKFKTSQASLNIADYIDFLGEFGLQFTQNDYLIYIENFRDDITDIEVLYGAVAVGLVGISSSEFRTTEHYDLLSTSYLSRLEAVLRKEFNIFIAANPAGKIIDYLLAKTTNAAPYYGKVFVELVDLFLEMARDRGSWDAFFRAIEELNLKLPKAKRIALEVGAGDYIFAEYLEHNGLFRGHEDVVARIKENRFSLNREIVPTLSGIVDSENFNEAVPRNNQELFSFGRVVFDKNTDLMLALSEAARFTDKVHSAVNDLEMAIENFRKSVSSQRPIEKARMFNQTKQSMVRHFRDVRTDIGFVLSQWYDARKIINDLSQVHAVHVLTLKELPEEVRRNLDPQLVENRLSELEQLSAEMRETESRLNTSIETYEESVPTYDRIISNFAKMTQDDLESADWRRLLYQ